MQTFAVSLPATTISPIRLAGIPHILFETWADLFPTSIAVSGENEKLTYWEVEQRANQIAHALRSAGVQRGDLIALFLERGADLVCALLGTLKAGAAFVALDTNTPQAMLDRIFASVDCRFLLSRHALTARLPPTATQRLFLDDAVPFFSQPPTRPLSLTSPNDPACVLFTSGSFGKPKPVLYLHRNLAARFSNTMQVSNFDQFSVFAQSSPVTSIDAIDEIFLPLVSGGCTAVLPSQTVTNAHRLVESLSQHKVTHMLLVPSLLRLILAAEADLSTKLSILKTWMIGGEPLTTALTRQFYKQLPDAALINFYGLTEGDATCYVTSPKVQYDSCVPVGRPVQDTKVYLLDERLNQVNEGQPGEICLAGDGLSHKYLNCPELNAERWIANPFAPGGSYARLFRTGDLGRINAEGEMEYLGRRDRLVYLRGFRVELGEVEAALAQHPAVDQCVVVTKQSGGNESLSLQEQTYVTAFVVLKKNTTASSQELRDFLSYRLPEHAIPATISLLNSFPLSPNGKVDFHTLSQLAPEESAACEPPTPPQDPRALRRVQM